MKINRERLKTNEETQCSQTSKPEDIRNYATIATVYHTRKTIEKPITRYKEEDTAYRSTRLLTGILKKMLTPFLWNLKCQTNIQFYYK